MKKLVSMGMIFLLAASLMAGCKNKQEENISNDETAVDFVKADSEMFTERDYDTDYDEANAVAIQLQNNTATATSKSVKISGSSITITEEATYIISGELTNGMIIVDAPETAKPHLVFRGITITNQTSAAFYILEADKVFVTLDEGTDNTLTNAGSFQNIDENNIDAVLFSKQDLTINGLGSLTISSTVGHGIVCKDDLVLTGGTYTIHSASHGIDANDSVRIANATLTIDAGKDMIHAENTDDTSRGFVYIASGTVKGEAEGDGMSASAYMHIANGTFELLVGGGAENGSKASSGNYGGFMGGGRNDMRPGRDIQIEQNDTTTEDVVSMKGLKATQELVITGGNFSINSADDAIHSDASLTLAGGSFVIASGDDAIHAEDTLTVTAGTIDISESYEGVEALHIDVQGGAIRLVASDDGLNAAGGVDQSGTGGGRDGMFGGGGRGGMGGGMSANSDGSIKISGGTLYICASGDGIDANGTLEITGGDTTVVGPTRGDTATLDYDKSAVITGGSFMGTGAANMAQSFSDSNQGALAVNVGSWPAETEIVIKDANGKTLITHKPELDFTVMIFSSPELTKGEQYTVVVGSASEVFEAQ